MAQDDGKTWRDVKRFPEAKRNAMEEIKVMRFDGHLTFTNVAVFKVGGSLMHCV